MYFVKFTPARVVEFHDPVLFEKRVKRFLTRRETENSYLLNILTLLQQRTSKSRMLVVEEEGDIVAVGVLMQGSACLVMTWATPEAIDAILDHIANSRWHVASVFGPSHCAYFIGKGYAQLTGRTFELGRAERVYHLVQTNYRLPEDGSLQVAVEADMTLVHRWLQGFVEEAQYENDGRTVEQMARELIGARLLYLWKAPRAVSMASWVCPTPSGAAINYVYTPPELRGRGYGKAVTAALANQMLASGLKYCAIRTDSDDAQANAMYQSIGGMSLCEFARCTIRPPVTDQPPEAQHKARPLALL